LLDDQLHRQCEILQASNARQTNGKIWAMGQKGFEICLFLFDVNSNLNLNNYNKFTAVNPENYTADDLHYLDAEPFVEVVNGVEQIIAIT
jgi:hypothetical protein